MANFTEQAKLQRVQDLAGQGDLQGAQAYLQANAPDFKPSNLLQLQNMLQPKVRAQEASSAAAKGLSDADTGYSSYLQTASAATREVRASRPRK